MRRKYWPIIIALILVAFTLLAACAQEPAPTPTPPAPTPTTPTPTPTPPAPAPEPITLKFAYTTPPFASPGVGADFFAKEVTERTNGQVKVETYPMGVLGTSPEAADIVLTGVTDISFIPTTLLLKRFPLSNIAAMPSINFPDTMEGKEKAFEAIDELLNKYPAFADEHKDFKVLWYHMGAMYHLFTTNKKITLPEDAEGLKIGGSGPALDIIEALGAAPISSPPPEAYEKLQTGVTEGQFFAWQMVGDHKIWEVAQYGIEIQGSQALNLNAMNWDSWNKLSPDAQNIMMEVAKEAQKIAAETELDSTVKGRAGFIENGGTVVTPTAEQTERWNVVFAKVWDKWLADVEAAGIDVGPDIFNYWRETSQAAWQ